MVERYQRHPVTDVHEARPNVVGRGRYLGRWVALVAVGAALVLAPACGTDDSSTDAESNSYSAFEACKGFVKDRLKSPSSAKFRNYFENDGEVVVSGTPGGEYTVISTVDSQNGFGAMLRTEFICIIDDRGDTWRLVDVALNE